METYKESEPEYKRFEDLEETDIETFNVGGVALARAGMGYPVTLEDYLINTFYYPEDQERARATLEEEMGFTESYQYPPNFTPETEEFFEYQEVKSVNMIERLMEEKGWKEADILVYASSTSHRETPKRIKEKLKERGITIYHAPYSSHACNGSIAGIDKLCRNPDLNGAKALVVGLETISYAPGDPMVGGIFGNGAAAIAFEPGKDIIYRMGNNTAIEKDEKGVLKIPEEFRFITEEDLNKPQAPPEYYELINGAENFYVDETGEYLLLPISESGYLEMDGLLTFLYFRRRVPKLLAKLVQDWYSEYPEERLGPALAHQPSKRVSDSAAELTNELIEKNGLPDKFKLTLKWYMKGSGFNNVSAATSLISLSEMIKQGDIEPGRPFPAIGYGVGSSITTSVWEIG